MPLTPLLLALLIACDPSSAPPTATNPAPATSRSSVTPSGVPATRLPPDAPPSAAHAAFPAGTPCADCHAAEASAWAGSHHALALTPVTLDQAPRFDGVERTVGGVTVTPLRRAAKGAGPETLAFRVKDRTGTRTLPAWLVIGVAPLQQYVLEADKGRRLIAPIAWNVEDQRWFDPSVDGAVGDPADALYWAGLTGTWNHMCASCHTTGTVEGFDPKTLGYDTHYTEAHVGCAACHGVDGSADTRSQSGQLAVCGPCHGRGEPVLGEAKPGDLLLDRIVPEVLDSPAFGVDGGTIPAEEVFELGPFLQSRMHAAGVRCTDCHDLHTGGLRVSDAPAGPNNVCAHCHEPAHYDTKEHTHHTVGGPGSACVDCHMPTQRYMRIDLRHDHHIRVPDPALAASLGLNDPCTSCHRGKPPGDWPTAKNSASARFARLVAQARQGDPSVTEALAAAVADPTLQPFRRASAATLLGRYPPSALTNGRGSTAGQAIAALQTASRSQDVLLRLAAVRTLAGWGAAPDVVAAALDDKRRAVRYTALRSDAGTAEARGRVLAEYAAWVGASDSPSDWTNLGVLRAMGGDRAGAEAAIRTALAIAPAFSDAQRNLDVILAMPGGSQRTETAPTRRTGEP